MGWVRASTRDFLVGVFVPSIAQLVDRAQRVRMQDMELFPFHAFVMPLLRTTLWRARPRISSSLG